MSTVEYVALVGMLVLSVGLTVWFVVWVGRPTASANPPIASLLSAWAWTSATFDGLLLAAVLGLPVPAWLAVLVLAARNGVWVWRLYALARARSADNERKEYAP